MSIDWSRFVELVGKHKRFLLTSHIRPDCDALGSELGMAGILAALNKQVVIVNGQKTPPNLEFIDPQRKIRAIGEDISASDLDNIEILMVLDTSAWAQLGPMAEVVRNTKAHKIVVDHHVSQDDLGAELFKDVKAEATGKLVTQAARQLGVAITPEIALPLFAAIATDTGWFRFGSTTGDTFREAGDLVDAGVRPQTLYTSLYEQDSLARMRLIGRALSKLETDVGGRLVYTSIRADDFRETGALPSDTEDIVNTTLAVRGAEVAVIFVEQPGQRYKVSFRSRSDVNCSAVAESFSGGGHKAAAGATLEGPFESVRETVLDAVRRAMR